ncbi:MAG TPA: hypothetical protein VIU38_07465 [Anaerolineales bacterium]
MRRGVTLIAAGITAFVLVISVSVVYAYRAMALARVQEPSVGAAEPPTSGQPGSDSETSAPALSARDVAAIASTLLQRDDAYSIELADWNGQQAYKVTFSSGDLAYMTLDGSLLAFVPASSYVAYSSGGGGGGGNHAQYNDDESHEEFESEGIEVHDAEDSSMAN